MQDLTRRKLLAGAAVATAALTMPVPASAQTAAPAKGPNFHRQKIGSYEVTTFSDGVRTAKLEASPARNAKLEDVQASLEALKMPKDEITVPFNPNLVNTGSQLILIDTGRGPGMGSLAANLAAANVDPKSINIVLISHFHGDHIGGLLTAEGAPAFPNAEIKVGAAEYAYWMDDGEMSRAPETRQPAFKNVRRIFGPIANKVTKFEWGKEVAPGITTVDTTGHSPGHCSFVVASGSGKMMVQGDVTSGVGALFVRNPGWHPGGDMDVEKGIAARRKLFDMLAAERMLSTSYHMPFPGAGYFEKAGDGYRFVPQA
jgi:glyoxylase-like metal-dependent hydrolase (beta-lactamase superfamily II)